ncbi:hypothetical protein HYU06_03410 [Candidatus Woesearchaeota archaeon]|nr:hypothetical protein [Candidatus Woesearchaeota archaeon]
MSKNTKKQKKLFSIIIAVVCLLAAIIMYNGIIMMLYSTSKSKTFWGFVLFLLGLYLLFTNKVEKILKMLFDK